MILAYNGYEFIDNSLIMHLGIKNYMFERITSGVLFFFALRTLNLIRMTSYVANSCGVFNNDKRVRILNKSLIIRFSFYHKYICLVWNKTILVLIRSDDE